MPSPTREINPADKAFNITADDITNFPPTRALYVGGGGTVRVTMKNGAVINFVGMTAGTIYPISVIRVWAIGTTATNLVGLS